MGWRRSGGAHRHGGGSCRGEVHKPYRCISLGERGTPTEEWTEERRVEERRSRSVACDEWQDNVDIGVAVGSYIETNGGGGAV